MNSHISKTSTFSAPVVQSRLEHHHQQQLKHPEARQHQHQRSKSLNKGKRFNYQKSKETTTFTSQPTPSSTTTEVSRNNNKNFSNFNNNFDSSYHRDNNLVENAQLQRRTSTSSRPTRRHQHSDSVDEDKFRVTPIISILKRPQSATDFVKSTYNSKSSFALDVTKEEQGFNNHRSNNKVGDKSPTPQRRSQSKERRRSDVTPSKSKRAQRKEVKSMEFDTDLMFNVNSPQPSPTQQLSGSSNESDVNSNNKYVKPVPSKNAVIFPPLNYSNAIIALEEGMNSNKKEDTSSNSDDNVTVKSSLNKKRSDNYIESTPRRLSSTAFELQSQVSRFADSDSILLSESRRPSSSPSRLGGGPKLYAGPTFHNSPAPSDLPMPSFYGKSLGKEPSPLSAGLCGNNLFTVPENVPSPPSVHSSYDSYSSPSSGNTSDDDIFAMDDFEPSKVPYYPEPPTLRKQKSQELLRILAAANSRQPTAASYMVPERMATAHHPMQVHPVSLNEISETLRSLLKIHGQ